MTSLLQIDRLSVHYGAETVVNTLSLSVEAGQTVALVGESGCGKSTTALALMGLLPREAEVEGRVLLQGRDLLTLSPREMRKVRGGDMGMIFQDPSTSLNPVLSVGRQIEESLGVHHGLHGKAARARVLELLERVQINDYADRIDHFPHQFSGGQRQRVMIAMAMAAGPKLLIADEPTTALDVGAQSRILTLLTRLKDESQMGLLLITHDLGLVGRWADRVAIMQHGDKVEDGPTERVFTRPRHPYSSSLLRAALALEGPGRTRPAKPEPTTTPVLSVKDLRARYVSKGQVIDAVDGVSFDIAPGETLGLVGASGCGKSTLSRVVLRLAPASGGKVTLAGQDITHLSDREMRAHRSKMQMVFQDPYASLNPRKTIGDILDETLQVNGVRDRLERRQRAQRALDRVQLASASIDRFPHEFSGGQRQRIGIARALLPEPSLLICDEPVSSLDLPIREQILNLLADLKADLGLAYLFISHDLSVVRYIADRVLVMDKGRIVEEGDPASIWNNPQHDTTRMLIASAPTPRFEFAPAAVA
jgi:peptide/nickel transport system ATP-binding protein